MTPPTTAAAQAGLLALPAVASGMPLLDTVYNCDAMTLLKAMPSNSANCIVTSPPYFGLRDYGIDGQIGLEDTPQAFVAKLRDLFREARRVLRDDGTCWINLGDTYTVGGRGGNPPLSAYWKQGTNAGSVIENRTDVEGLPSKSLLGMPWRVAFALQDDGWILRSDIIWAKPNPMPESVTDRPTKAHEYVFLLTKNPAYWYDAHAIREPAIYGENRATFIGGTDRLAKANIVSGGFVPSDRGIERPETTDRNKRSVWTIPTEPTPFAHFATFPQKLIEPMILAGCPDKVCVECGAAWVREVEREALEYNAKEGVSQSLRNAGATTGGTERVTLGKTNKVVRTDLGFKPTCTCNADTRPGIVLDPFFGSGTTALVARKHGRRYLGSELNPEYVAIARERLRLPFEERHVKQETAIDDLPLFAGLTA